MIGQSRHFRVFDEANCNRIHLIYREYIIQEDLVKAARKVSDAKKHESKPFVSYAKQLKLIRVPYSETRLLRINFVDFPSVAYFHCPRSVLIYSFFIVPQQCVILWTSCMLCSSSRPRKQACGIIPGAAHVTYFGAASSAPPP